MKGFWENLILNSRKYTYDLPQSVYRQLGDFSLGRGPVGGSASWGKGQLGTLTCRISWAQFLFLFIFI